MNSVSRVNVGDVNANTLILLPSKAVGRNMSNKIKPRKIAIVAWQALPAVFPELGSGVGGIETSAWMFAKSLSGRCGLNAMLVLRSNGKLSPKQVEGVAIHADVDPWMKMRRDVAQCIDVSNRRLRRFRHDLFWKIPLLVLSWPFRTRDPKPMQPDPRLTDLDPDLWVAMGVNAESAGVIATAKFQNKPSVLMIRSGADLDPKFCDEELFFSPYGERSDACCFALQQADYIVCQTEMQRGALKAHFSRDACLVRNPIDACMWRSETPLERRGVLWVGRYENFAKRIGLVLEIARRCPELPFTLIANPDDPDVESEVRENLPANVELIDYVPFTKMPERFASAEVFLSTSSSAAEGFPNVLLQATASGTPIVSLEDFDGYLCESGSGVVAGQIDVASEVLKEFVSGKRMIDWNRANDFLQQHHEVENVMHDFADWLSQLDC